MARLTIAPSTFRGIQMCKFTSFSDRFFRFTPVVQGENLGGRLIAANSGM